MTGQAVILLIPYLNGVIKHISGRTGASLWFRRYTCGFSVAQWGNDNSSCRHHVTTVRESAPEARRHRRCHVRYTVGRLAASTVNGVTMPRGTLHLLHSLQIAYFGGWKNFLFYDPRKSSHLTFRSRFCRKFCDLYASIYGTLKGTT